MINFLINTKPVIKSKLIIENTKIDDHKSVQTLMKHLDINSSKCYDENKKFY